MQRARGPAGKQQQQGETLAKSLLLFFEPSPSTESINQSWHYMTKIVLHIKFESASILLGCFDFRITVIVINYLSSGKVTKCCTNYYISCPVFVFGYSTHTNQVSSTVSHDGNPWMVFIFHGKNGCCSKGNSSVPGWE